MLSAAKPLQMGGWKDGCLEEHSRALHSVVIETKALHAFSGTTAGLCLLLINIFVSL